MIWIAEINLQQIDWQEKSIQICYACVHTSHLKHKIQKRAMFQVHIVSLTVGSNKSIKWLGKVENWLGDGEERKDMLNKGCLSCR